MACCKRSVVPDYPVVLLSGSQLEQVTKELRRVDPSRNVIRTSQVGPETAGRIAHQLTPAVVAVDAIPDVRGSCFQQTPTVFHGIVESGPVPLPIFIDAPIHAVAGKNTQETVRNLWGWVNNYKVAPAGDRQVSHVLARDEVRSFLAKNKVDTNVAATIMFHLDKQFFRGKEDVSLKYVHHDIPHIMVPATNATQAAKTVKELLKTDFSGLYGSDAAASGSFKSELTKTCKKNVGWWLSWACSGAVSALSEAIPDDTEECLANTPIMTCLDNYIQSVQAKKTTAGSDLAAGGISAGSSLVTTDALGAELKKTCELLAGDTIWKYGCSAVSSAVAKIIPDKIESCLDSEPITECLNQYLDGKLK